MPLGSSYLGQSSMNPLDTNRHRHTNKPPQEIIPCLVFVFVKFKWAFLKNFSVSIFNPKCVFAFKAHTSSSAKREGNVETSALTTWRRRQNTASWRKGREGGGSRQVNLHTCAKVLLLCAHTCWDSHRLCRHGNTHSTSVRCWTEAQQVWT